jgi:UDP-N-acetylglucosamine:LPS N-acetylglucosamine transferase
VSAEPVVAPGFRPAALGEQAAAREKFGLPPGERLALVVSGSWGVGQVEQITRDVAASGAALPVVVCGRNEALRDRLRGTGTARVFGWIDDMPALMRACDVVVQNAGGLTTLEALATGLPVLTYRCLPGHGRANARILDEIGLVPWIADAPALARALTTATKTALPRGDDPARLLAWLATPAQRAEVNAA